LPGSLLFYAVMRNDLMRPIWLAALLALTLASCGSDEAANNSAAIDQVLADDNLTGNDLTAIDAVAAADSNMAADIALNAINVDDSAVDNAAAPATRAAKPKPAAAEPAKPAVEPATPAPAPAEGNSN
jgi:hypothetical protein